MYRQNRFRWSVGLLLPAFWLAILAIPTTSCTAASEHVELHEQRFSKDLVGHWEGTLNYQKKTYAIKIDISRVGKKYHVTIDLPEYLVYGAPTEVAEPTKKELTIRSNTPSKFEIKLHRERDRLVGKCIGFRGVKSEIELRRTNDTPVEYQYESVEFKNGDGHLRGTFVKPKGKGPFPTIVWTHGSGPDTRKTFYYSGRAHLLAQHGVASLIYDKRGAGKSTGSKFWDLTVLTADALAAIDAIKTRQDVDRSAIGIAGFSQGGWIAPAVAAKHRDVDFVIVGATPGITSGEQNIFSMVNRMRRDGVDQESIAAAKQFVTRLYRFYETGKDRQGMSDEIEKAKSKRWFKNKWVRGVLFIPRQGLPNGPHPAWSPFSPDPMDNWRKIQVPVLSMWGSDDIDVPAKLSRQKIEQVMQEIGNTKATLKIFKNANHGMWKPKPKDSAFDWPRQEMAAQKLMVQWVKQRKSPRR